MKRQHVRAAAATAIAAAVLGVAGTATAAPGHEHDHENFGAHVSHHARTMGFDGDLNPGMHRGAAGWDHEMP